MAKSSLQKPRPDLNPRASDLRAPWVKLVPAYGVRISEEYDLSDAGGRELLCLICEALDRVERLRTQIDKEGEIVTDAKGTPSRQSSPAPRVGEAAVFHLQGPPKIRPRPRNAGARRR